MILIVCLLFASCMDITTDAGDDDGNVDASGIWIGSQTIMNVGAYDMKTIVYDGKIPGISEDAGVLYSGTYDISNGSYLISNGHEDSLTSYKLYDICNNGNLFTRGVVTSIGVCLPKIYDNGLTYDEYRKGKTDLEKDAEKLDDAAKELASGGEKIIKSVWKAVWK